MSLIGTKRPGVVRRKLSRRFLGPGETFESSPISPTTSGLPDAQVSVRGAPMRRARSTTCALSVRVSAWARRPDAFATCAGVAHYVTVT